MLATGSCEWSELLAVRAGLAPADVYTSIHGAAIGKSGVCGCPRSPGHVVGGQEPSLCSLPPLPGGIPALGPSQGRSPQPHSSTFNPSPSDRSPETSPNRFSLSA